MKLNDVITPDQLRTRIFGEHGAVEAQKRWDRCFEQVEPYAKMIAEECEKRRIPREIGGAWTGFIVGFVDHLMDEEEHTS